MAAAPLPETDAGWYLFGVVPQGAAAPQGVELLAEGPVAGLAARVSLAEFDESVLPVRLADAAWLEEKIRAHEQVLEFALEGGPVVPCRFCTVYRDERELRRFLAERGDVLAAALARLEGRVELGVKAFAAPASSPTEADEPESGRAYLEARQRERQAQDELARARAEVARDLHERLSSAAEDAVLLDLQTREASGRDTEMVFNASYLVADEPAFEAALVAAAGEHDGLKLELTGPWPPYNFVPEELARG